MTTPLRVLIVEDSPADALLLTRHLQRSGYALTWERVETAAAMHEALARKEWDFVIADYQMPQFSGLAALALTHELGLDLPFIIVSGTIGEDVAVAAMKAGAHDYIMKDNLTRLTPAVDRELREAVERSKRRLAEQRVQALNAELIQAQKLEALGHMAGGVAHDFNNLLTVIMGGLDLACATLPPDHPAHTDLEDVRAAADRAIALTRQLLTFARRQAVAPQIMDLNSLIEQNRRIFQRMLGADVELITALADDLWCVRADPQQMEQVLFNLVVNARDAMPAGGTLHIATANRTGPAEALDDRLPPGELVQLTVRDTGVGMTEEVRRRIFEPFFTTKGPGKGTGLGLSTCYGIIQQVGGVIRVRSAPLQGATFTIVLPRAGC
ncbi:MAG TPA: ATP-binding protein [Roseiflexaceae bacterium]|nr:ATP-binding protein [Roseiflexaceae bacterium]